jgi:Mg2+/Co2+ transporter CorC
MKIKDLVSKEDQRVAIKLLSKKKKKNNSVTGDIDPHNSNFNTEYGMSSTDRVDGVIHP